jgi:nucleoside 2-deoxyribosyltransferase
VPSLSGLTLYFAGPLFSEAEKRFNESLARALEEAGLRVFLPQRDGVDRSKPPYDAMDPERRRRALFELDRKQIAEADVFLFVLDGRVPDEGACVELGIAYACKWLRQPSKLLVGMHTDDRAAFLGSKLNPMLRVPLDAIVATESELLDVLGAHAAAIARAVEPKAKRSASAS